MARSDRNNRPHHPGIRSPAAHAVHPFRLVSCGTRSSPRRFAAKTVQALAEPSRGAPGPLAPSQAEASHRAQRQHGYANSEPTGPSIGPRRRQATRNIREDGSPGDRCRQPFRYTPGTQWTPDRDPSCGDFPLLGGSHTGSPTVHPCPVKAMTYAIVGNTFTHYPKWIIGIRLPDLGLASSQGRSCPHPTTRRFSL